MKATHPRPRRTTGNSHKLAGLWSGLALLATSCIIDTDNPCSEGQIVAKDGSKLCICPEGEALTPAGCLVCGENEEVGLEACDCVEGFARNTPDDECTEQPPMTLGDAGT